MTKNEHWEHVFVTKDTRKVSWFETEPAQSMALIRKYANTPEAAIVDIGGGDSQLADFLLAAQFEEISVLDITENALIKSQKRLQESAVKIDWIVSDITTWNATRKYDLWHDRAVFHFLIEGTLQEKYKAVLLDTLAVNGIAIIATFSKNGTSNRCSNLPVCQHDEASICSFFAPAFELLESFEKIHETPSGGGQLFVWNVLRKIKN